MLLSQGAVLLVSVERCNRNFVVIVLNSISLFNLFQSSDIVTIKFVYCFVMLPEHLNGEYLRIDYSFKKHFSNWTEISVFEYLKVLPATYIYRQ